MCLFLRIGNYPVWGSVQGDTKSKVTIWESPKMVNSRVFACANGAPGVVTSGCLAAEAKYVHQTAPARGLVRFCGFWLTPGKSHASREKGLFFFRFFPPTLVFKRWFLNGPAKKEPEKPGLLCLRKITLQRVERHQDAPQKYLMKEGGTLADQPVDLQFTYAGYTTAHLVRRTWDPR